MEIPIKKIEDYAGYKSALQKYKVKQNNPYNKTKLKSIYRLSSSSKSAFAKNMLREYLNAKGIHVGWNSGRRKYIYITLPNDKKYSGVVKSSFLWEDGVGEQMRWEQIRTDDEYDIIIFVAIYTTGIKFRYATLADFKGSHHKLTQHAEGMYMLHGNLRDFERDGLLKPLTKL